MLQFSAFQISVPLSDAVSAFVAEWLGAIATTAV